MKPGYIKPHKVSFFALLLDVLKISVIFCLIVIIISIIMYFNYLPSFFTSLVFSFT